jgi:hypothetical protein
MMMLACLLALLSGGWSGGSVVPAVWPGGGFISYVNDAVPNDSAQSSSVRWPSVVGAMHDVGLDTIIITRTMYEDANGREWSFLRETRIDPTERILRCADSLGMHVFIGLWEDVKFGNERLTDSYLRHAAARSLALMRQVWDRYHAGHPSFIGWYIPLESWNIGAWSSEALRKKIQSLHECYRSIAAGSRQLAPLGDAALMKIAVSVYFNPENDTTWLARPHDIETIFPDLLHHSGIDMLLLQDGAGSHLPMRGITRRERDDGVARQYLSAFSHACLRADPPVQLWAVVEIFRYDSTEEAYVAASYGKLLRQLGLIHSVLPSAPCILFDFYHFMNPFSADSAGATTIPGRRRALYEQYRSAYMLDREE